MAISLHYKISGEGIPFLFQHGLGAQLAQTQSLLSGVKGVQLISADCPGHGATPLPNGQILSFDYYVTELAKLLDELNIERAIFGGISMGAGIATQFAIRFPERVKALVLVRPAWLAEPNPDNLMILKEAARYIGQVDGVERFKQDETFQAIEASLPLAAKSILGVFGPQQQSVIPLVLEQMVSDCPFDDLEKLRKIKQPCLIFGNEDDPLHPWEMAQTIHQYLPNSQLEKVISRYVHNRQHKMQVTELVNDFINQMTI
ncbi:MAG: alpha/beta hydrolase [Bacteroidota bacterium]